MASVHKTQPGPFDDRLAFCMHLFMRDLGRGRPGRDAHRSQLPSIARKFIQALGQCARLTAPYYEAITVLSNAFS
jgi:hypothetical protein